ncbi:response regulator [Marivirga salinae]|uniref:Response regulator n=1 Tax=Marivirga salinarum TaxID=3059078 RepID=A0AA51N9J4_9BACT|nr:response regulator [Marivirga sp. BDSF4-3]WMN10775.1 response regulator [Marivirga sp. BDSF4-3]
MPIPENKGLNILLIEDNPGDQVLVSDFLQEEFPRLKLETACNFKEAKTSIYKNVTPYKIILLDLSLPDIDHHSLLKEIIVLAPNTPIIILTGQDDIKIAIESLTLGYADYLLKDDLTSKRLRKSIIHAFERKHIDKQLETSVKRYQQLFQLNPQPIWVINRETGDFLEINNSALNQYGYSKNEFLKMKIQDIDEDYDEEKLRNHLTEDEIIKNENLHQHKLKNGKKIQVKLYGNRIDYQGFKAILLMAIDLTETESYISQIEAQNQQLKEIAWEQSHLVREPLTRMMGIIHRLEEKYLEHINELDEECSFLLKNALTSSYEIDDVIRSIVNRTSNRDK